MNRLLGRWLDLLPLPVLAVVAVWLGIAPLHPQPHLIEKWTMLLNGTLSRPIDVFDLLLHTVPLVLLAAKLWRTWGPRSATEKPDKHP